MTVDLGCGDGRAVLAAAAAQSDRLVVGVDANAAAMAEASRRAARKPAHGGLPNALFMVAAAEALPPELARVAELVTVQFPWGSLLRGLLAAEPQIIGGVAGLLDRGGRLRLLVSSTDRDRGAGVEPIQEPTLPRLVGAWEPFGLAVTEVRPATPADVAAAHSSWGRRLGAGRQRPAWLLDACQTRPSPGGSSTRAGARCSGRVGSWARPRRSGRVCEPTDRRRRDRLTADLVDRHPSGDCSPDDGSREPPGMEHLGVPASRRPGPQDSTPTLPMGDAPADPWPQDRR